MAPTDTNIIIDISEEVPKWINVEIFEKLLNETVNEFKCIKQFKIKRALSPGENYATIMLRVKLEIELNDGKLEHKSYMLKVPIDNEVFREMMKNNNIFTTESKAYQEIVPEMHQMYKEVGVEIDFSAKCYILQTTEDYVLLEDLTPRGFKNVNRLEGLDMEHAKCVLEKLAMWHAVSATRIATKGVYTNINIKSFFDEANKETLHAMFEDISKIYLDCMKQFKGHEQYIDSIKKLQPTFTDELIDVFKVDPNEFNVLNHGDCWANNIMFTYDDAGKVKDTYLVDLQMLRYGTPAQDLMYFLLSSINYDLKLTHFNYFIKFYHDHLVENLKLLKYPKKIPALKDIHISTYKCGIWGYCIVVGILSIVLLESNESANLDNFISTTDEGTKLKILMYTNERYRKHAEAIMPWLQNRGAFE